MKTIHPKNAPTKLPFFNTIVVYLFLQHFNTPLWIYFIVSVIVVLFWVFALIAIYFDEYTDIFKNSPVKQFNEEMEKILKDTKIGDK